MPANALRLRAPPNQRSLGPEPRPERAFERRLPGRTAAGRRSSLPSLSLGGGAGLDGPWVYQSLDPCTSSFDEGEDAVRHELVEGERDRRHVHPGPVTTAEKVESGWQVPRADVRHRTDYGDLVKGQGAEVDLARLVVEADGDDPAAWLHERPGGLEPTLGARHFVDHDRLVVETADMVDEYGRLLGLDDAGRAETLSSLEPLKLQVSHEYFGAELSQRERQECPDTAGSDDQHMVTRRRLTSGHRVVSDSHGLGQGGGVLAQLERRHLDAGTGRHGAVLSEASVPLETDCCVPQAKIGPPSTAALARAAGDPGSADHEISLRQIRNGSASADHTSPQFVPGDHRSGVTCHGVAPLDRVLDRPVSILVRIGAADTGSVHLEHYFVGAGRWVRPPLYTDVGPAVINGRLQFPSPIPVRLCQSR